MEGKINKFKRRPLLICLVSCTPYACIFPASTAPSTICTQQGREPRPPVPNVARWEPDVQQQAQRAQEPNQNNTEHGAPIHQLSKDGISPTVPHLEWLSKLWRRGYQSYVHGTVAGRAKGKKTTRKFGGVKTRPKPKLKAKGNLFCLQPLISAGSGYRLIIMMGAAAAQTQTAQFSHGARTRRPADSREH